MSAQPTRLVGKYRLGAMLGRGGMCTVYEAEHVQLGRRFALKFLRDDRSSGAKRFKRLDREARLLARLEHENIVALLDVGVDPELGPYLVLEYLAGRTLRADLRDRTTLSVERTLRIAEQISRGLASAHAIGIVHRDLKPENVMLLSHADGSLLVKLLDFGIARCEEPVLEQLTATDAAVGTAAYMSPEQAVGKRNIDGSSDVWALGVLMYEALSGVRPYEADSYNATIFRIVNGEHRTLAELRPDVPKWACAAVEQALRKSPTERPDVVEFMRLLRPSSSTRPFDRVVDGTQATEDQTTTGVSTVEPGLRVSRARSRLLSVIVAVVTVLAVGGLGISVKWRPTRAQPLPAVDTPTSALPPLVSEPNPVISPSSVLISSGPENEAPSSLRGVGARHAVSPRPKPSARIVHTAVSVAARRSSNTSVTVGGAPGTATRLNGYIVENPYAGGRDDETTQP
jgi:serine/threonine protein kinase